MPACTSVCLSLSLLSLFGSLFFCSSVVICISMLAHLFGSCYLYEKSYFALSFSLSFIFVFVLHVVIGYFVFVCLVSVVFLAVLL